MTKSIAVLGATGSVGTQALSVAEARGYRVDYITASKNSKSLEAYARKFSPRFVAMADESAAGELKLALADTDIKVLSGREGILEGIAMTDAETVINSIIGEAGLFPTLAVIENKKRLALANKESLVIAGEIVMRRASEAGVEILPVDSEHSAIFQSLFSGKREEIKRIILTASGGPFFGKSREELKTVTLADTLAHPTWKMGKKITVDSATLMNKGYEIIEAAHLFGVPAEKIKVVVHRESILHSAIEYIDNAIIGELSVPDMSMCVQYAVDFPDRMPSASDELDLVKIGKLSFYEPDYEAFPLLSLASEAMKCGSAMPAVLNAADEVAVDAFLHERIPFFRISEIVSEVFSRMSGTNAYDVESLIECDRTARIITEKIIEGR
ncbi:MAG: 1-deoxy-D-xylulose-5-phosphate reductoisomerase [Clostridia bacterium]|nr:1-deoxy-D-xylulose-5-phosphate reductoisomerase [Clostridia bacterium]